MRSASAEQPTATVIGGGPAGLMAADVLATAGVAVTVHEHTPSVGRKLLLAGRGGLNITHSESFDRLLGRYGVAADRLEPALRAFGPAELRAWCARHGEPTFVGSSGRVFPASFRATPLLRSWLLHLERLEVRFALRRRWIGWETATDGRPDVRRPIFAEAGGSTSSTSTDVTVLALGGASWPRVGSDGGWVPVLRAAGIDVRDLRPANCGVRVAWSSAFAARFAGTPVKNVAVSVGADAEGVRGDAMITVDGMEGGPVYAHSSAIRDVIDRAGRCVVTIDLHPDLSVDVLTERLARRRQTDSFATGMRRAVGLSPVAIAMLRELTTASSPSSIRTPSDELARLVKALPVEVESVMPIGRAISSAGGIALDGVDDAFMLRSLPGTFVAGEMLDWDAPTGGYLLQASFSTGVAAANGALAWLASRSGGWR